MFCVYKRDLITQKMEKHAIDVATDYKEGAYQYTDGNYYYVTDGHRVIQLPAQVDRLRVNAHDTTMINGIKKFIDTTFSREYDYTIHELPTLAELRDGVRKTVGRRLNRVVWSDGVITFNARYLIKAMDALNAKVCYITKTDTRMPIQLFKNDDLQSETIELILPIYNAGERKGFWES